MSRVQMNLNVEEEIRDGIKKLCDGYKLANGQSISAAALISLWVKNSLNAGYPIGVSDITTVKSNQSIDTERLRDEISSQLREELKQDIKAYLDLAIVPKEIESNDRPLPTCAIHGLTDSALSVQLNIPRSTLTNYRTGKSDKNKSKYAEPLKDWTVKDDRWHKISH